MNLNDLINFYSPRNYQKTYVFLIISGGMKVNLFTSIYPILEVKFRENPYSEDTSLDLHFIATLFKKCYILQLGLCGTSWRQITSILSLVCFVLGSGVKSKISNKLKGLIFRGADCILWISLELIDHYDLFTEGNWDYHFRVLRGGKHAQICSKSLEEPVTSLVVMKIASNEKLENF